MTIKELLAARCFQETKRLLDFYKRARQFACLSIMKLMLYFFDYL